MRVLVVDVGGTHVKLLVSGKKVHRQFDSGNSMKPAQMVRVVKRLTSDWPYTRVSIGYPGLVVHQRAAGEPRNLGDGWVGFNFEKAFGCPVKVVNDAAMQAIGSYEGGRMLFLGLGTGLGSAMIDDGQLEPMELAHFPYKKGRTFEECVGLIGLKRLGKKKWRGRVTEAIHSLSAALEPDYVVVGGGNARKLKRLPQGVRLGNNEKAFTGGFRLWEAAKKHPSKHPHEMALGAAGATTRRAR